MDYEYGIVKKWYDSGLLGGLNNSIDREIVSSYFETASNILGFDLIWAELDSGHLAYHILPIIRRLYNINKSFNVSEVIERYKKFLESSEYRIVAMEYNNEDSEVKLIEYFTNNYFK